MRLLTGSHTGQLTFTEDHIGDDEIPPYAILSHTWQHGEEVTFSDVINHTGNSKAGWDKIQFCAQQAKRNGLHYIWVDTCCINKAEHIEVQDAINSMFRWYQNAAQCYVYLWDVSTGDEVSEAEWEPAFRASRWFTRGWTLQELLAPRNVEFFSREGKQLGDKRTLERQIHEITGIATSALQNKALADFSIEERLSWIEGRHTTRKEDQVYSLLGIFGIFLVPNYGEGKEYAMKRFKRELDEVSKDLLLQQKSYQAGKKGVFLSKDVAKHRQGYWLVPLSRPRSFAGRDAQLAQLRAHVSSEGGERLAVYGLGGCGKTALALEFAYWTQEQDPMRAVFWIPAISRESFEQAFHEIATMLCIQGIEDDKTDVKQKADAKRLVKARLSDEEFGKWLIIVDNADDTGILLGDDKDGSSTQHLISDLPRSGKGSIIFTTRTRAAAIELAEDRIIALGEFENAEAIEILHKRLLPEHQHELRDNDTVNEFLGLLLFHALAIVQAIAFVNTNDVTLFDYISLYRNSERDAIELLSEEFEEQGRYREATNSIATTWFISFEQIQKKDKIAAAHLFFMACIANNDIEPSIFPPQYSQTEHVKALGTLKAHAFITERQPRAGDLQGQGRKVSKTFDVHRLVHLTIRGWLKGRDQWQSQISTTLTRFIEIVPHGDHDMRKYWTAYLHHAIHLADLPEAHALVDRATLLDWIAECKRSLGRYQAAERAYRQAFEQREIMLGKGNRDTISTLGNLGQILGYQERWVEAEIIHRKVLALMETFIGKEDQHTLTCRGDLAMALLGQSKTLEAEKMYQGLLLLNQKVHGNKHPQTLTTMHNIGATLVRQGKYADAEQLLRETLALNKEVQGEDHEYTLSNMGLLGSALSYQSKYAEAEAIHKEELALKNKVMVEGHPESLRCMRRVGLALSSQQKYVEAEQVLRKALSLSEKVHGNTSLSTLRSKYALAKTLRAQMKYTESEQLLRETLAIEDTVLGKNHVDTIYSVSLLAALAHDQMQYEEALPLYERACAGFHSTLGPNHPTTIECLENYTWIQRVVEEDRVAAASKAKRVIANTTEDPIVAGSAGLPSSSTAEVALRPQERWRQKMKKWRKK